MAIRSAGSSTPSVTTSVVVPSSVRTKAIAVACSFPAYKLRQTLPSRASSRCSLVDSLRVVPRDWCDPPPLKEAFADVPRVFDVPSLAPRRITVVFPTSSAC